ncbi:MAG: OadG family protein [Christensenella sp.]|uniref:OadG family protein n=1 Tax=Christensenella sp. TaxID=1935934 RepID=UPI002B1EB677|nr:OadG family protein [Christensenella sp.]MEA5003857.1 OadG family protein [Christensenella sp.]
MGNDMTIGQDLAMGGQTIALGLMVVFVCLALIIVIMVVMSAILKERKKETGEAPKQVKPIQQAPVVTVQDDELLAVLTAAVAAAMESERPGSSSTPFVIRSYKKVSGRSAWGKAGRQSQLSNW